MVPKNSRKPKAPKEPKTGAHHRAAQLPNARDLVCPECWTTPPTIRKDGVTLARHPIPAGSKARTFKGNDRCYGQGRMARYVVDDPWEIGTEPKNHISALEYVESGTSLLEERQAKAETKAKRREERAKRAEERGQRLQAAKEAKAAKAAKPKAERKPKAPKVAKAKPRKAKTDATEAPVTEAPAAA